eukprot:4652889-Pleurochrysis_carterae.AAC.4
MSTYGLNSDSKSVALSINLVSATHMQSATRIVGVAEVSIMEVMPKTLLPAFAIAQTSVH